MKTNWLWKKGSNLIVSFLLRAQVSSGVGSKTWKRIYDITWWFFVKTNITNEFSVVDLVKIDSQSPVWSKFEKQSRMCFDQIHIKSTFYRPLKGGLLSYPTPERRFIYQFWKPSKNAIDNILKFVFVYDARFADVLCADQAVRGSLSHTAK